MTIKIDEIKHVRLTEDQAREAEKNGVKLIRRVKEFAEYLQTMSGKDAVEMLLQLSERHSDVCDFTIGWVSKALHTGKDELDKMDADYAEGSRHMQVSPDDAELKDIMAGMEHHRKAAKNAYDTLAEAVCKLRVIQIKHMEAGG